MVLVVVVAVIAVEALFMIPCMLGAWCV